MNDFTKQHRELLRARYGVDLATMSSADRNFVLRELSKPLVFLVSRKKAGTSEYHFHGFSSIQEGIEVLLSDMITLLSSTEESSEERYHLISNSYGIAATFLQGKVVKLHPKTEGVAVLVESEDNLFDTMAGLIPANNLEIVDEQQASETSTQNDIEIVGGASEPGEQIDSSQSSLGSEEG